MFNMRGGFETALAEIKSQYDQLQTENKQLRKRLDDYDLQTEIVERDNEIKKLRSSGLSDFSADELKAIKEFRNEHYAKCKNGSTYIYKLTGTGVGTAIEITCPKCGETKDVTDWECM